LFLSLYEIYFPLTEKKLNPNFSKIEPWSTKGLLIQYNLYNRTVRAGKKLYNQNELALNQSNLKRTWELIRSAANMPTLKKDGISQVSIDGELISDPTRIATKFNAFFTSMPAKSPPPLAPPPPNRNLRISILKTLDPSSVFLTTQSLAQRF
jgi:hypothetical protein